jgi:hypothetical protein
VDPTLVQGVPDVSSQKSRPPELNLGVLDGWAVRLRDSQGGVQEIPNMGFSI